MSAIASTPTSPQPDVANESAPQRTLRDVEVFKATFDSLYSTFTTNVIVEIEANRDARALIVDVIALQATGKILPHQTFIAQRIIDINISRELPDHISYLTQSRRFALFEPLYKQAVPDTNQIEMEFRRVMTYQGWITDYERWADCTKLHGYGFVDVCYDEANPGGVSVEYIPAGQLMFDPRVKCIQQAPIVARTYLITSVDLVEMARDYNFDKAVTDELLAKLNAQEKSPTAGLVETNRIYRVFFKEGGIVYTAWYTKDLNKQLSPVTPFFNGVSEQVQEMVPPKMDPANPVMALPTVQKVWKPTFETDYPFYPYLNRVTEDEPITRSLGRAAMDFYLQEAASSLVTSLVNGANESAATMWSPDNANMEAPTAPRQLDLTVKHGAIWNTPMKAFRAPFPDAGIMSAIDMLRTQNSEDTNQVSFATNNRKDTRKTATEIEAAQAQDSQMSSISVTNWATAIGGVIDAAWRIVRSLALQGKIVFCPGADGANNVALIGQPYRLIPAGTTDYVERMEMIQSMQSDWPIVGTTASAQVFLEEYLRLKYPTIADKLIAPLQQQEVQQQQVVQALHALLQQAVTDEEGNLLPEWKSHAAELAQLGIKAGEALTGPNISDEQSAEQTPTE